ncbi:hypothetical protein HanXRQr2_Chr03g0095691 [Helianthus annuus]|uniref:Uncharacterized protein n=1 Tax=Helianthus annuus TaxID=4232 RepID=A0A9K3NVN4_HELAN|nr:hypothetical protein HanXRQr2_Chr03g0095691 [Helianthus annuus]
MLNHQSWFLERGQRLFQQLPYPIRYLHYHKSSHRLSNKTHHLSCYRPPKSSPLRSVNHLPKQKFEPVNHYHLQLGYSERHYFHIKRSCSNYCPSQVAGQNMIQIKWQLTGNQQSLHR